MRGNGRRCPECGARLKSDYQFCNLCGSRLTEERRIDVRPAPRKVTHQIASPNIVRNSRSNEPGRPIARQGLITTLFALLAMVPFTPWISTFNGAICFYAAGSEVLYGRYILLLAMAGLLLARSDRFIPDITVRRSGVAGTGFAALLIIAIDYLQVLEEQQDPMSQIIMAEPGLGMYMGTAIGVALMIVALLPQNMTVKATRPSKVRIVRPGSPGSDP